MKYHRHKFNAKPRTVNNIWFGSDKEARYYENLLLKVQAGHILFFHRQVPFDLPGGVKYRVDFQEFRSDGTVHYIDVKGHRTAQYIMKKKMVEDLYPVEIEEV